MGKLSTFKIVFSKDKEKYQPGDLVEGHIAIEIKDGIKVKGIYLECVGEANVGWSESQPTNSEKNRRNHIRHYKANEVYFRFQKEMMKRVSMRRDSISINEGSYMYPFSFRLPPNIPSSFEGSLGHIRYWITGTVEKAWGSDHTVKWDIKVTNPLDVNLEKDTLVAQSDSTEAVLCCLCCRTGPIVCEFSLEKTGYVPGDAVSIYGQIHNHSNRKIGSTSARLMMHSEYHAEMKSKSHTTCVAEVKRSAIKSGKSDKWEGDPLKVPPLPTSYLRGCSIISVSYWIELVVHPSGPAFEVRVPLKVIIGSIPLIKTKEENAGPSSIDPNRKNGIDSFKHRKSLPVSNSLHPHAMANFSHGLNDLPNVPENPEEGDSSKTPSPFLRESSTRSTSTASPATRPAVAPTNNSNNNNSNSNNNNVIPISNTAILKQGRSRRRVSCHQ